jgi:RNA polymerase sigma factor (TIGR02999 family)
MVRIEEMADPAEVTQLLNLHRAGDRDALDRLLPLVYEELRRLARAHLRNERDGHTLQPTALVHEAYVRLTGQKSVDWENRAQFLGIASQMMRRVLVNYAVARQAAKRQAVVGGGVTVETVEGRGLVDVLVMDQALTRLKEIDERQERIVELRCFAGLSVEETAEVLGLSTPTVKREWSVALLWLRRELARTGRS